MKLRGEEVARGEFQPCDGSQEAEQRFPRRLGESRRTGTRTALVWAGTAPAEGAGLCGDTPRFRRLVLDGEAFCKDAREAEGKTPPDNGYHM